MITSQGGVCAINGCGTAIELESGAGGANIDHDHACDHPGKGISSCASCVRGILCNRCNGALGFIENFPERFNGWIAYLERSR